SQSSGTPITPAVPALTEQLAAANATLAALLRRLTPEHPDVVRQQRVVRELEQAIAESRQPAPVDAVAAQHAGAEVNAAIAAEIASLQSRIATKEAEYQRLLESVAGLQTRIDAAPNYEGELVALTRDYEALQKVYAGLLTKAEESKMAAGLEQR